MAVVTVRKASDLKPNSNNKTLKNNDVFVKMETKIIQNSLTREELLQELSTSSTLFKK